MKASLTRVFCLLLLLSLVWLTAACGAETDNQTSSSTPSTTSTVSEPEPEELFSNLPQRDFGGETVTFLVEGDYMTSSASIEVMPQPSSYQGLQDAVSNRNGLVEEQFHVKIAEIRTENYGDMLNKIRNNSMAGVSEYDVVMPYMSDAARLAQEGLFYDLKTLSNMHLDRKYYDQGSVKDLSILNKNYFVTGDLSLQTYRVTHCIVFNRDLIKESGLEEPYDLVRNNNWTIDKLREMARTVTADTDGDTGMGHLDTYGFLVNQNFISSMFIGAGQRFTKKNHRDEPEVSVYSETSTSVFDKIFELVNDPQASGWIDGSKGFGASAIAAGKTVWQAATEAVASKRALFRAISLHDIFDLSEFECNFGILPTPKLSANQETYCCRVSNLYATCVAIPINVKDVEMSSIIIDAMMQASTDTTKDAYFEVIMKLQKIKDDESEEMLDLIFDSRVYDFGSIFNWGGTTEGDPMSITGFMNGVALSGSNTFVSTWQGIEGRVQTALEETLDAYRSVVS